MNKQQRILLTIFLLLIINIGLYSIKKPKIKSGVSSKSNFNILEETDEIYPSTIQDHYYIRCEDEISDFFKFIYKTDFYLSNYNKYSKSLEDLQSYIYNNYLSFILLPYKNNKITVSGKPMLYYKYGEIYFKLLCKLQYKFSIKHFAFTTGYSYMHTYRDDELYYHNIIIAYYWSLAKREFVKFKSSISTYFQYYDDNYSENYIKLAEKPFLRSVNFSFEVAIDFNKIDFEEVFKNNDDDEFFED